MRVRVPCSTSNLGPGFDALGLALGLYLTVDIDAASGSDCISREGDPLFCAITDENDLFLRALRARWASRSSPDRGVRARLCSELPTARGLGSSSVAVVAGVCAADALDGLPLDRGSVISAASRIEGHPDNAAPAVLGGLTCAYQNGLEVFALRLADLADLWAVVLSPDEPLSTHDARAVLPETVGHREASENLGRALCLSHALAQGHRGSLGWAFADALHQPFRARLLPGLTEALAAAENAGALGAWLSGAGSSSVALVRDAGEIQRVRAAMREGYASRGVRVRARVLRVDATGVTLG